MLEEGVSDLMGVWAWIPVRICRQQSPNRAGLTQPRGICRFIPGLGDGTCGTQTHGPAPTCSLKCPPFCGTRVRSDADVVKSRHPEAAAAAGRNLLEPFL